mmetsp:Transcript_30490/g.90376  ORF Transcript_30490/g.90376 Transcript_30490/m.90376 type:complete len:356 (+) Transcript_30490:49-1116(+)
MHRSLVRWKVDPALVVHKRLPWHVRRQQLRQQLWQEEPQDDSERTKTPGIVVQIAQAARAKRRQPRLWTNLLGQAMETSAELSPQDMANILWSMSEARFQHHALLDDFVRSLSHRADVKAMVTAMLAVDRLGLSTDTLRAPFLQNLSGECLRLSFGDLRRILMALARCWQSASVHSELLDEICGAIVAKSENCDPRDLVAVPQHLGRLRYVHRQLFTTSTAAIATLVSSRLAVIPLDVLRAFDGLLLLLRLREVQAVRERLEALAGKCRLLAQQLLRREPLQSLWSVGAQTLGAEVAEPRVWAVWAAEVLERREAGVGRARCVAQMRKRIRRQWSIRQPPEGLEVALQGLLRQPV